MMNEKLPTRNELDVAEARTILPLLGWTESGMADYYFLGKDVTTRYPIVAALECEAERLAKLAGSIRATTGSSKLWREIDPPSSEPVHGAEFSGEFVALGLRVSKVEGILEETQSALKVIATWKGVVEDRLTKVEGFKKGLVDWIKNVVEPPGSRDWVRDLRKPEKPEASK